MIAASAQSRSALGLAISLSRIRTAAIRLLPTLAAALFLGCLRLALASGPTLMSGDGDPARHLLLGEYIVRTGTLPSTNFFVHSTPDQPFLPHEWLAQVASALSHRAVGLAGPVLLHGSAAALAFSLVFAHLRRRGVPLLLALGLTLVAANVSQIHWQMRPHVFTFLGLALFHLQLERFYRGELRTRTLLWLVPAMALWANLHGAFALGLVLIFSYVAADAVRLLAQDSTVCRATRSRLKPLVALAVACLGATLLNPRGVELLLSLHDYTGNTLATQVTTEFQSPDFRQAYARPFLALLLGVVAVLALSPRRPSLQDGALAVGFTYLALTGVRNIALFAIALVPVLGPSAWALCTQLGNRCAPVRAATYVSAWIGRRNAAYTRIDAAASHVALPVAALIVACGLAFAQRAGGSAPLGVDFDPAHQPVYAVAAAERLDLPGEVFNQHVWGGYLELQWWPERRPFIDGELNSHSDRLIADYLTVAGVQPGWESVLRRYGVRTVLFDTDSPLVRTLAARSDWQVLHRDALATLLVWHDVSL